MEVFFRKPGRYPQSFPNGWFVILESSELGPGEVKEVDALGLVLAVFRGESGEVFATEAYCPHLGANLCSGGIVKKDCIVCPFHKWTFSGETGECISVPYSSATNPKNSRLKTFPVREQNQFIYLWFHTEGEDPSWCPEVVEEVDNGSWTYHGRSEYYVNVHIQVSTF